MKHLYIVERKVNGEETCQTYDQKKQLKNDLKLVLAAPQNTDCLIN